MITIFSTCRPFEGIFDVIQRNAIGSWLQLPEVEIILLGDDDGVAEFAQEVGVQHIPDVKRWVRPYVSDLFAKATASAPCERLCYINSDIIVMEDLTSSIWRVSHRFRQRFLMIGQRVDLVLEEVDFQKGWQERLREKVRREGRLHGGWGIDYFAFRKGQYLTVPPYVMGCTVWDNYLVASALSQGIPVVDATRAVLVVHQDHPLRMKGLESPYKHNRGLVSTPMVRQGFISNATWRLLEDGTFVRR